MKQGREEMVRSRELLLEVLIPRKPGSWAEVGGEEGDEEGFGRVLLGFGLLKVVDDVTVS